MYIEYFEKAQEEFMNGLKQAQDLNVKALESLTSMGTVPTPAEFVERTFAFTNEMLETRKAYMTKLAELATDTQKQFAEAAKRIAEAAKN